MTTQRINQNYFLSKEEADLLNIKINNSYQIVRIKIKSTNKHINILETLGFNNHPYITILVNSLTEYDEDNNATQFQEHTYAMPHNFYEIMKLCNLAVASDNVASINFSTVVHSLLEQE